MKEKESIQRGLKDLEVGRIFSHLEVMADARLRLAKRKKENYKKIIDLNKQN